MKKNTILDKITKYLSECKASNIIIVFTVGVLVGSVPMVYMFAKLFEQEYTFFLLLISVVLPLILTPVAIALLIHFSKNLKYYKQNLTEEIEKNKQNHLLLFEKSRFILMGEMMANISHQWKQPLNNVALAIVSSRFSDSEELRDKNFDIMEENISYLSNTINDFMSFFEKRTPNESKSIGNIIDEVKSIMSAQIESNGIKFTIHIDEKLKFVEITSIISQVLLNLLNNAKDAIDKNKPEKEIILYFKVNDDGLEIDCCDNGSGIKDSIVSKIFDPYFTTKDKTRGTGIGLYMSKEIITKMFNGTIEFDNSYKMTCFRIHIPCSKNCQIKKFIEKDLV